MDEINQVFRTIAPDYLEHYGEAIPLEHRKAMQAVCDCRTEACGSALYRCEQCGESHSVNRSCGNRHCRTCQHHKSRAWLARQRSRPSQPPQLRSNTLYVVSMPLRAS